MNIGFSTSKVRVFDNNLCNINSLKYNGIIINSSKVENKA